MGEEDEEEELGIVLHRQFFEDAALGREPQVLAAVALDPTCSKLGGRVARSVLAMA